MEVFVVTNLDLEGGMPVLGTEKVFKNVRDAEAFFMICASHLGAMEEDMESALDDGYFESADIGSSVLINSRKVI